MKISDITAAIERFAPLDLQEDYDNSGLIVGQAEEECTGVLLTVDVTETTVAEAIEEGCNLIVSHHPLIFKGLKRLTGSTPTQRAVIHAIKGNVAIYASHTSMDNAHGGVSWRMAELLELDDIEVLQPMVGRLEKLTVYVPATHATIVREALFAAGAGHIGNYDHCSYNIKGEGTFRALDNASPHAGRIGEFHTEAEERVELILPKALHSRVEETMRQVHPYEEPAYEFTEVISGADRYAGSGVVGNLTNPLTARELATKVKDAFGCKAVRCSEYPSDALIRRVALCGGSGAFLTGAARAKGAQAYITADIKYHEFADAAGSLFLVDAGHFETEQCITSIFHDIITEIFPNFAVRCSRTLQNPVTYM